MFEFNDLRQKLAEYLSDEQISQVARAYLFAEEAHEGQKRSSGEPYISHPLEVAAILADMHMDHQSIIAAMLHDVIEDTHIDKNTVATKFGEKIAELVDGVSKLKKIKFNSHAEAQAENFRKMMLAMAQDIRVILIKLADRLHNMRTLGALPPHKRHRIALETLEIYAPIANRLGMNNFRTEFEELGFQVLYPMRYRVLKGSVKKIRGNRKEIMQTIANSISERLKQESVTFKTFKGREKHLYSIYRKMRDKDLSFTEVMDVYAFRIIVENVSTCYQVLGIVHNLYKPVPGRFKDYIAVPKANGYQSLHTVLLGPYGMPIEIQIRTVQMSRMAENGIAAHWLYKSPGDSVYDNAHARARAWLQGLLEIQQNTKSSLEFIENVKIDLYPDDVYVFTPKGQIMALPAGATPVDFAYAVHTAVGNSCVAAKIDRKLAPLSARLQSGQTVDIVTAPGAHANPAWLSFVVTGKARSNIRNWLKTQERSESEAFGKRLLERALGALSTTLNEIPESKIRELLDEIKLGTIDDLFADIGIGNRLPGIIAKSLVIDKEATESAIAVDTPSPVAIRGTEGMVISYAKCCSPIPGDPIMGLFTAGRGIVIHQQVCNNVAEFRSHPEKCIDVSWEQNIDGEFETEINVDVINTMGVLAKVAAILSECNVDIVNVSIDERDGKHNTLRFKAGVKDRVHLGRTMKRLRHVPEVMRITRGR